jgi:hypothetical protein
MSEEQRRIFADIGLPTVRKYIGQVHVVMTVAVFCSIGERSRFLQLCDILKYRCDYDQCSYGLRTPYGER